MRVLLLTIIMIFASSASAGLYKWVDDEGNVHYSQKRPRDKQFQRLKAPPPAPEGSKPLYQSTKLNDKSNDAVASESAKIEKIRASNCTQAKKNLNIYKLYSRIRDKDGNLTVINDNVRAQKIESAKKAIRQFCN